MLLFIGNFVDVVVVTLLAEGQTTASDVVDVIIVNRRRADVFILCQNRQGVSDRLRSRFLA